MKKLSIVIFLFVSVIAANAQHQINSFFNAKGAVRLETYELKDASDTLASVFHRTEDIVWSRVVYRVIDMRYKQNYQLYFPTNSMDPQYRNLFKVMLDAVVDGMPVYGKSTDQGDIKPEFMKAEPKTMEEIPYLVEIPLPDGLDYDERLDEEKFLITYDSIEQRLAFQPGGFDAYVRNQLKFLIQEVVFFDKHYSRLFTKIIGIAPMYAGSIESDELSAAMWESILFWVAYDDIRPYMARQYVIPQANDTRRVTFEQFFAQKLYTSYLIGDSNMYSRMFADFAQRAAKQHAVSGASADEDEEGVGGMSEEEKALIEKELKREQQRVQDELMNFELDLWEY